MNNPLLQEWKTPFGTPPFDVIRTGHFKAAIEEAIKFATEEIKVITDNKEQPDFENTVASLDRAGETLGRITSLLFNLNSAETNKDLQEVTQMVSPLLTRFSNDITLNKKLFKRIKTVFESKETSLLTTEQKILTERKYRNFILGGAALKMKKKNGSENI